jgi:hypothetical protein
LIILACFLTPNTMRIVTMKYTDNIFYKRFGFITLLIISSNKKYRILHLH